ncbi:MAG: hypothetical protein R3242_06040 [Akkermansiaceae bacterium]|nr:hypothetical protein [Akkermansiaceae bacterium]
MKPRITLAETTLPDGSPLVLLEHDGRKSLEIHGQQICGPSTRAAEEEVARLACAPFRPARQPKILQWGLGLGSMLGTVCEELKQKRGRFLVAEEIAQLPDWHRQHLPESPLLQDPRVELLEEADPELFKAHAGSLSAILIHLDVALPGPRNKPWPVDRRWLAMARDALQEGGLLAIAASSRQGGLYRSLQGAGFQIAEHEVAIAPKAKRTRMLPIWLARKGQRNS